MYPKRLNDGDCPVFSLHRRFYQITGRRARRTHWPWNESEGKYDFDEAESSVEIFSWTKTQLNSKQANERANCMTNTRNTDNVIHHRTAPTTERRRILRILRILWILCLLKQQQQQPPPYLIILLYKLSITTTLASIMSNNTTITALWWPAWPRLLISFQFSSLLFLLLSNFSNS